MADHCCQKKSDDLKDLAKKQAKVLWTVLAINLVMFFAESISGFIAGSTALMGDSLDMLGDALAYGSSIYVIGTSIQAKAKASLFKASIMVALGLLILGQAIYKTFFLSTPDYEFMGIVGMVALIANVICLMLLTAHKDDDINFQSVWICSRNDIIANTSVILAGLAVYYVKSPWPDLLVGFGITLLFLKSAMGIFKDSFSQLEKAEEV